MHLHHNGNTTLILLFFIAVIADVAQGFGCGKETVSPAASQAKSLPILPTKAFPECDSQSQDQISDDAPKNNFRMTRRDTLLSGLAILTTTCTSHPESSQAACLAGDTSTECIGYYKMPVVEEDDAAGYFDTAENLSIYAPDVRWVPPVQFPKTYKLAREELMDMQKRIRELPVPVLKGELVYTGKELLEIVPRITAAGRVVIRTLTISSLKSSSPSPGRGRRKQDGYTVQEFANISDEAEDAHDDLLTNLAEIDIVIGQYLKGKAGAIIATQVQILQSLKEADASFSNLMKVVPIASKVPQS